MEPADYAMNREERIAIMTICGRETKETAERYCDSRPDLYGKSEWDKSETQGELL